MRAQADGDDVRTRILDAAQELFASAGYAGATTREIAARAGIGKRMLFYYFPTKEAMYEATLNRVVGRLAAIHGQIRNEPGPIGLGDAVEALTHFTAANLAACKLVVREIMDGGPHLARLAQDYIAPLFAAAGREVAQNQAGGIFRPLDPMHALVNVGGLTLWYFLNVPLLRLIWDRDPLAPDTVAERAAITREFLLTGLAGPASRGGNAR